MDKILDKGQVADIFVRRMNGQSLREIAAAHEISRQYTMKILNREAYKDVQIPARLVNIASNHVALRAAKREKRNHTILTMYENGHSQVEIAKRLKCGTATVCRVVNGKKK
jgi:Mor family transcriptional regulator